MKDIQLNQDRVRIIDYSNILDFDEDNAEMKEIEEIEKEENEGKDFIWSLSLR